MDSNNEYVNINKEDIIKNRQRGDILYYSIDQVANLLDQENSTIRYYTNVFDNILKIEISNKEFKYTDKDIDKLEFLINLKNKGMTIKEIQKYCEELPLNLEELVEVKANNNALSVKELMKTFVGLENKEINNLKEHLSNQINEGNESSYKRIEELISEQNRQLKLFGEDLITEIKQYIDYKFDIESKSNKDLHSELSLKIDNLISEKISLEDTIKLQLDALNEFSNSREINLINEIKKFKNVIERAYYVQQEIESSKPKGSFMERIFRFR